MPDAYDAPLGLGGTAPIIIPIHRDLTYSWTAPPNDFGASGHDHTKKTYFNTTVFIDPLSMANPVQFICFSDIEGHATIPAAVVDKLAPSGFMTNTNFSHFMEAREAAPGEMRRFDLVSRYCNISLYQKQ